MVQGIGARGHDGEDPAIANLAAQFFHLAMAAAREAHADARLDPTRDVRPPSRRRRDGVPFGGLDLLDAEKERMSRQTQPAASPYLVPGMIINRRRSITHLHLYGPSAAPAKHVASGGHAITLMGAMLSFGEAHSQICQHSESISRRR